MWGHPWDVRSITGYVSSPIAQLTEPFLLCHIKPSSCRACVRPTGITAEMKYKSQFARLFDGWRRRAAQINNQIHVPANTNTGITATAPSQLELISAPPPLLGWTDSGTDGLVCCVTVFFFLSPARLPAQGQNYLTSSVFYQSVGSGSRLSVLPVPLRTGLGNCFPGICQAKTPHLRTGDASDVKSRPVSFYPAQKHIAAVALQDHKKIKGKDALFSRK